MKFNDPRYEQEDDTLSFITNEYGYGQYVNAAGDYVCPETRHHYVNRGEGVLSFDPEPLHDFDHVEMLFI